MNTYEQLLQRTREIALLSTTSSLLSWDQETRLPPEAAPYRAEQLAHLSGLIHRLATSDEIRRCLESCEADLPAPGTLAWTNITRLRRRFDRAVKLPPDLVESFARASSHAHHAWVHAKEQSRFDLFAPHLQTLLDLTRQKADCWGYADHPYDALLEGYEPGMTTRMAQAILDHLASHQASLLAEVASRFSNIPDHSLAGHYPISDQQRFNAEVATAFGFNLCAGRIDTAPHPFCTTLGPRDIRLTTRYRSDDFTYSLYSVIHEVGHGLYEQGLPAEHFGLPAGEAASLGLHESQSRLWENKVARTLTFWDHWFPRAAVIFPDLAHRRPEDVARHLLRVQPSLIRTEADEVSYDLHIILRFQIELGLLSGEFAVRDVPSVWNEKVKNLLGLEVPDDAHGCLQDIHWSMGGFGYFPTYTFGNLASAQLYEAAIAAVPSIPNDLAHGQYDTLLGWMREHVHAHGERWTTPELVRQVTGQELSPEPQLRYLRAKYLD
ncbi:MAG: carboxypeptidase M32 [Candidatus Methylacidiphilales bacterium]